ncbi:MAG: YopX family protein [Ruminococcus flavefaciens]|nr:YopX family protein [Ruminococcus flavefaciens]
MNREILFRGQHRRKGEKVRLDGTPVESKWVYGGVCQYNGKSAIIYQTEPEISKFLVYADTLGQYTGLTDKNGRKIFEGDIIRVVHNKEELNTSYIYFEDGAYWCKLISGHFIDGFETLFDQKSECGLEIIGNVFDNAELLKGENNG